MTDLDSLIARVERLDKPDREVDALIGSMLVGPVEAALTPGGWANWPQFVSGLAVPAYTASTDAILDLIERRLPEAKWYKTQGDDRTVDGVEVWWRPTPDADWLISEALVKHTLPLALVLAFLHTIKSAETSNAE